MKVILNLAIINWTTLDYEKQSHCNNVFFTDFFSFLFKILLYMIMSRQKCQVILFVGMDAQVLKIPDYDTPENWILLRYIRDKLWQLIEFCRLLTILGLILGQLPKKKDVCSALYTQAYKFNVHMMKLKFMLTKLVFWQNNWTLQQKFPCCYSLERICKTSDY